MTEIVHRRKWWHRRRLNSLDTSLYQLCKSWWRRHWFKAIPNISKERHQISLDAEASKETEISTCLRFHWTLDTPEVLLFCLFMTHMQERHKWCQFQTLWFRHLMKQKPSIGNQTLIYKFRSENKVFVLPSCSQHLKPWGINTSTVNLFITLG